jgi:hypothetical protein
MQDIENEDSMTSVGVLLIAALSPLNSGLPARAHAKMTPERSAPT